MIKQFVITTIISLCLASTASAQTFTQRLQKTAQGEGTVTLHQDKAIDELVNGSQKTKRPATADKTPAAGAAKPDNKKETGREPAAKTTDKTDNNARQDADTTALADKKAATRTYKTTGYRVQVYAGGNSRKDRMNAEQTGNQLRMLFPNEAVYTHFYSPRWICRIGNYRTYEEAHNMLQEVKRLGYDAATIVKGRISVPY